MKSTYAVILISCMIIPGILSGQEKISLKYGYEKGKTYRYSGEKRIESVQEINRGEMKSDVSSTSLLRIEVRDVSENGDITMIHSYEDMKIHTKMDIMDTTMTVNELLGKKSQVILSGSGRLVDQKDIDTADLSGNMFAGRRNRADLSWEIVIFPDSAIKTGDSWIEEVTDTVEGTQMMTKTIKKYTLAGEEEKNGHKCRVINFTGDLETWGKMTRMGMDFYIEGSGESAGSAWIDKESGILVFKESTTGQDMTMALTGQMQMTIPITTTSTSKFYLIE